MVTSRSIRSSGSLRTCVHMSFMKLACLNFQPHIRGMIILELFESCGQRPRAKEYNSNLTGKAL
jgi:hypothetical protein